MKERQGLVLSLPPAFVLFAFLALAGAVSVLNPLFESTDEIRHYRYVRHLVVRRALPVQGAEAVRSQSHHPPLYYALSAVASAWVPSPHTPAYEQPLNPFWGYRNWEAGVDNKLQYLHGPAEQFPFGEGYLAAMIPRWVNVLLGAMTVWLTYQLGRRVWPQRPHLAWGAAALLAFNPQFIYLSAAMNNDVIAAATGTAVLILCVQVAGGDVSRRRLAVLGLAYGLALMAKFHLIVMGGVIALAIFLARQPLSLRDATQAGNARADESDERRTRPRRAWSSRWQLVGLGIVLSVAALLAGWWFLRNWWLYGDPTGLNKVNELWAGRPAGGNWWALKQGLPYLWNSLWARFGYGQIPLPQLYYTALLIFCTLALAGYLFPRRSSFAVRSPFRFAPTGGARDSPFVLLLTTILGFTAVVFYYILIQPAGSMGRFLFPALPALAVLLLGGLDRWIRRPLWTAGAVTLGMGAFALVALGGYLAPAVRYPSSVSSPPPGRLLEVQFADVARALAVEVEPDVLQPGEPLFVTVVWEPLRRMDSPYAVYVHLVDEVGAVIAQRDTWPGLGRAPTTTWQPGCPFADTYRVDLPETAYTPNLATVRVGLYEPALGRLPVFGPDREDLGDGVTVGEITLDPRPGPWPNAQQTNFAGEITLLGYTLEPRALAAGETCTLTLYWQPHANRTRDYSVFAQVLDSAWQVWGSHDGAGPDWSAGEVVQDVRRITLLPDTPPGSYPVQVGLYHSETGRLPVLAPDGHYLEERVLLGPVLVADR